MGHLHAVVASQRTMQEIYHPAFRMAVDAGVGAVMCSYNRVNGTYACENAEELTDTLRDAWNFDGLVMSDWGALHSTVMAARSASESGVTVDVKPAIAVEVVAGNAVVGSGVLVAVGSVTGGAEVLTVVATSPTGWAWVPLPHAVTITADAISP